MSSGRIISYQYLGSCLDMFSLRREQVWMYSVINDIIYEMKKGSQSCRSTLRGPSTNQELNPKDHLISAGYTLLLPSMINRGNTEGIFITRLPRGTNPGILLG